MRLDVLRSDDVERAAHWLAWRRRSPDADLALLLILSVRDAMPAFATPAGVRWVGAGQVMEDYEPLAVVRSGEAVQIVADGMQGRLRARGGRPACVIGLHFTDATWRRFASAWPRDEDDLASLLPMHLPGDDGLSRQVIELLSKASAMASVGTAPAGLASLPRDLLERQTALRARLTAVPGRNARHRRALFQRLLRVREVMAGEPARWPAVETMAEQARLSPFHFARTYARLFGITPHQELSRARLRVARRLLADPRQSISDIASALGYGSRSSFTRWLSLSTGEPPTAWRKRIVQEHRRERLASVAVEHAHEGIDRATTDAWSTPPAFARSA